MDTVEERMAALERRLLALDARIRAMEAAAERRGADWRGGGERLDRHAEALSDWVRRNPLLALTLAVVATAVVVGILT
jgi:hypothetical protein